jgi:hypothetical protein
MSMGTLLLTCLPPNLQDLALLAQVTHYFSNEWVKEQTIFSLKNYSRGRKLWFSLCPDNLYGKEKGIPLVTPMAMHSDT